MCDLYQIVALGLLISAIVYLALFAYISYFWKPQMRSKPLSSQEKHLIEVMYSQLCSMHHVVPPISIALIVGASSIRAIGYGATSSLTQYTNASIILLAASLIFLYYDTLYTFRKMKKYEEVLEIKKVLKKFKLPSP
jgi:H+/gluconate symporter-like permease